jgi:hypothetical protein
MIQNRRTEPIDNDRQAFWNMVEKRRAGPCACVNYLNGDIFGYFLRNRVHQRLSSGGIYLSEMKSVLKRIHRGISERSAISYAAAETRVHQRLSFTLQRSNAYSLSLQSTAATRGS